jgi:glycosyltransferase involved in cell wall biosynthesis
MCRFVCTSTAVLGDLHKEGVPDAQIARIPNGIETKAPADRREPAPAARVEFLFVGSLTPKKNTLIIPEAVSRLPAAYQDRIRIRLLGDGPQRSILRATIERLRVAASVELVGFVRQPDVYLATADVFLLPSLTEGLSNAALEAMSWGLPLILSHAGGNTDLICENAAQDLAPGGVREGDAGLLIDAGRPESLADALRFMVDHPGKRRSMGQRSFERAGACYSMERVATQYEELYEQCCLSPSKS